MNKLVSVIIPTKNEEKNLFHLIKSLNKQNYQKIEIIVVDNYSEDQTEKIAKGENIKFFQKGKERSSQRNFGAKKAKGNYLLFLDADMEIEKGLIEECVSLSIKGFSSIILSEKNISKGYWTKCRALEKECYLGDNLIEASRCFEKKIFLKVGGYDEKLIASEDWDLHQRIKKQGAKIARTKSFVVHHEKETNPYKAAVKKYYYGQNLALYFKKHPRLSLLQYQPFRPAFIRHLPKLFSNPHLLFGLIILKSAEYLGGGLGMLKAKIK